MVAVNEQNDIVRISAFLAGKVRKIARNPSVRSTIAVVCGIGIVFGGWYFSGYPPVVRIKGQALSALAFTPDGNVLATGTLTPGPRGYVTSPIRFLSSVDGADVKPSLNTDLIPDSDQFSSSPEISHTEFSPNGKLLAVLQDKYEQKRKNISDLMMFAWEKGELLFTIPVRKNLGTRFSTVPARFFSQDSKWLMWMEEGPVDELLVRVWDLENGKEAYVLRNAVHPVFSLDSTTLATIRLPVKFGIEEPFTVQLWDLRSGTLRQTLPLKGSGYGGWRPIPSFSPDGRLLAENSAGNGGEQTVEVYETATSKRVFQLDAWSGQLLADGSLWSRSRITTCNSGIPTPGS